MGKIVSLLEGKIIIYSTPQSNIYVEVVFNNETFWATQKAMATLFEVDKSVISRHLKNIFDEEELDEKSTVAKIATVQIEINSLKITADRYFQAKDLFQKMMLYRKQAKHMSNSALNKTRIMYLILIAIWKNI